MKRLYDISPPISEKTALFPGERSLEREIQCELTKGAPVNLSSVHCSVHIGAHADAPFHYDPNGATIDTVPLEPYLGECVVATVKGTGLIGPETCEKIAATGVKRVLFRTLSYSDPTHFSTKFSALSPAAIAALGRAGVLLVGIDTPSIDPAESKDLPAHKEILRWHMRNLENLWLKDVPDGRYELIALPLKLVGFDASPVRAILRDL